MQAPCAHHLYEPPCCLGIRVPHLWADIRAFLRQGARASSTTVICTRACVCCVAAGLHILAGPSLGRWSRQAIEQGSA